jgi:hypothetical protein
MDHFGSRITAVTLALVGLAGCAASASAQQLQRIELRARVTESQLGEIAVGETVRVHATPGNVERFRIPARVKITVEPPAISLEPVVQAQFLANGPVTRSRIAGIRDGDRLECTISLTRLTCVRQRANATPLTFRAALEELVVVND